MEDLFDQAELEFVIDGVALPNNHSIFKLFPGKTYRLAKAMRETNFVFLDISGIDTLADDPRTWLDDDLLRLISLDRVLKQNASVKKRKRSGSREDKKRLGYLKSLFLDAKLGDLILVPLGDGFSREIAVGELVSGAGDIELVKHKIDDDEIRKYGRRVRWIKNVPLVGLSPKLIASIQSPTAWHVTPESFREQVYDRAYGTYNYQDIFVARFPTKKEELSSQDLANIGVLFNGLSVAHDNRLSANGGVGRAEDFYHLGLEHEGSAQVDLQRNSPISLILRTVGPLAFSAAAIYAAAGEAQTLQSVKNATLVVRRVGNAPDRCRIEVPPDMQTAAIGLGQSRYDTFCKVHKKVERDALMSSPARLKKPTKGTK